jgi:hypothetical protein
MKMNKSILLVLPILLASAILFSACTKDNNEANNNNTDVSQVKDTALAECYDQCEQWGGEVDKCKQNCDASNDPDSVWNQTDEDIVADNDSSMSWADMPIVVPEFEHGEFVSGEEGMGSWIVEFDQVSEDAFSSYSQDLKDAGWKVSGIEMTGMITGSIEGYTISVNIDKEGEMAQIIVRKDNN